MTRAKSRSTAGLLAFALGAALWISACNEEKRATDSRAMRPDAGPDKYATADPKLEKALHTAAAASAAVQNGPPPEGIFSAGVADQRHPRGEAAKVDVVSEGADPRIDLFAGGDAGYVARAKSYGPALLELGMQMGPRVAMPTVDFGLSIGPGPTEEGGANWLVADVKRAVPAKEQLGQLPPGTDRDIASLAGTSIRLKLTSDGRESNVDVQLGKGSRTDLDRIARGAAEAIVFAMVPLPPKAVGVGAQWISESRMPLGGVDAIAYSAYRVKSIDGERVRLELKVKAYASNKDVALQGVPQGATLEQFNGEAQGEIELVRGEFLARKSTVQQRLVMVFLAPGNASAPTPTDPADPTKAQAGNMLTAQIQSVATLVRGEDLRSATRQP